ncbi:MAG: penicillin-binding transpeptidase domain-containing protein [Bdellovibrionales bacterium]|nr:penicillin-binding transpeptidase domain-containing protein [Bdellovibrionales bacterium]
MKSRIIFAGFVLGIFYIIFVGRGAWLQFFPDQRLITVKKKNFETLIKLKPRRGIIYDRHGRELAITVASQSLFADPSLIKYPKKIAKKLGPLLNIPYHRIYKKIKNKNRRFVWLKRHTSEKESNLIQSWKIRGLAFLEEPKRVYPNGSLLAQTLGFVGHEGHGLEGLELIYDKILSGEETKVLVRKDAMGRPLFSDIDTNLMALRANGTDIYLTIDSDLQFFFEKELKKVVEKYSARSALGVIMAPQTGEIMAMANYPSFDLNHPFHSDPGLFRNRCVTDAFEPGSTLKPFIMSAALKKGILPSTRYDGMKGQLSIEGHIIKEAESTHQFENMTLREILSYSSNVGAAQVALDLGDDFLYHSLKDFGFGTRLGFVFPGESAGILNKTPWKKLQLATIGFGHSISVTPLQIVTAYSAIANGGLIKQPYLTQSVFYKESGEKKIFKPKTLNRVLTSEQAKVITVMLISAVSEGGTGVKAQVKGFLSAGKTGTAQVVDSEEGGYIKGQYISSFAGFIPAHDPKFVIYVVVQQPQKKFYGSTVAAPVFSKVAEYAVRQSGLSPVLITEKNILQKAKKQTHAQNHKKPSRDLSSEKGKTPDFIGLSLRKAYQKARKEQILLKVKGSGQVIQTHPPPLSPLPTNKKVELILSE